MESVSDSKNGVRSFDSDKTKAKCKLYVGSQALGYRRDHMEVCEITYAGSLMEMTEK